MFSFCELGKQYIGPLCFFIYNGVQIYIYLKIKKERKQNSLFHGDFVCVSWQRCLSQNPLSNPWLAHTHPWVLPGYSGERVLSGYRWWDQADGFDSQGHVTAAARTQRILWGVVSHPQWTQNLGFEWACIVELDKDLRDTLVFAFIIDEETEERKIS